MFSVKSELLQFLQSPLKYFTLSMYNKQAVQIVNRNLFETTVSCFTNSIGK